MDCMGKLSRDSFERGMGKERVLSDPLIFFGCNFDGQSLSLRLRQTRPKKTTGQR